MLFVNKFTDPRDKQAVVEQLKVLVAVANADGHIDDTERGLLEAFWR